MGKPKKVPAKAATGYGKGDFKKLTPAQARRVRKRLNKSAKDLKS